MEEEILDLYQRNAWDRAYIEIRNESMCHQYTTQEAMKPENRYLNRYRDVLPYDHSRVVVQSHPDTDYINASLVKVPRANRCYVLAQGPLASTVGHFWLTVWQQNTRAVLMLNRVIEKGQTKCHQYWPQHQGQTYDLEDVGLKLEHVSSEPGQHYTVRTLKLTHEESGESREILHFHYTTWPDFGVPQCPDTFLEFLKAVRESGSLDQDCVGPPVVHCSAGIGRSGTFCLVDSCLVLIEKEGPESLKIRDVLLEMRNYRMGLIQTPDQLKFSYVAIAAGAYQAGHLEAANKLSEICQSQLAAAAAAAGGRGSRGQGRNGFDSSSSDSDSDEDDDDSDDDDDMGAPPLPPPRTESLLKAASAARAAIDDDNATSHDPLRQLIDGLDNYQQVLTAAAATTTAQAAAAPAPAAVNGEREEGELEHPKSAGAVLTGAAEREPLVEHKKLAVSVSAGAAAGDNTPSSLTTSPTKCILNNHKLEERKREMELRRRVKEEKRMATESKIADIKKGVKEAEEWARKRKFMMERAVPFCVGLAMFIIGAGYFYYTR